MAKTTLEVFTVVKAASEGARDFWLRIGSAWVNRDRSVTVRLNALPLDGTLIIKQPRPSEESSSSSSSGKRPERGGH